MRRPLLLGCICLFAGIALWMQIICPLPINGDNTGWEGETVLLSGQVYQKEYRIRYGEEVLILYLNSVLYSQEADASAFKKNHNLSKLSDINPIDSIMCELNISELPKGGVVPQLGSKVLIKGTWQTFAHATNPGEFDAANYYGTLGISAKIKDGKLWATGKKHWKIREALFRCKQHLLSNLYKTFPQKEAAILAKMLLGDGSSLDEEVRELYQNNGIVHILSISGLHITMIGMGVYKGLRKFTCPLGISAVAGAGMIILYGAMTGFGISACRAIGMYLIHMLGEFLGKTYDMLTAMGILAVGILFDNPGLVYHSGYLLSFASVCGVGILSPMLQLPTEWFQKRPGERSIISLLKKQLQRLGGNLSVSAAVTIFTLPVQLFFFFKVPVYSVIINLFVIPLMSVVMIIGILVMLFPGLCFMSPIVVGIFAWFEWLCNAFEKLPGHTWLTGRPQMWKILAYYVVLLLVVFLRKYMKKMIQLGCIVVLVLFIGIRKASVFQVTFLDVGQGDCICVQTTGGKCFLFDGGSSDKANIGDRVILPFLQYYGIGEVDGVFLSHPDKDHYSGLLELLKESTIAVGKIYLPDVGAESQKDFTEFMEGVGEIEVQYIAQGDIWKTEDLLLTCLHPLRGYEADSNMYSACMLLEKGDFSLLLTGDVEGDGESLLAEALKERGIDKVNVLKVAHHGSRNSTSENYLTQIQPQVSVISCGEDNRYGHPHRETLERLEKVGCIVVTTPEYGAITVKVREDTELQGWNLPQGKRKAD